MTYQVHITGRAERDLGRAVDYIEFSLKNPQAADSVLAEAEAVLSSLGQMPKRYAVADDTLLSAWEIRYVQIKNYLAFYTVDDKTKIVHIIRFLYRKSDWRAILHHDPATE